MRKEPDPQQATMMLVLFCLFLFVNVAFVQAQQLTHNEVVNAPLNAGVSPAPVGDTGLLATDSSIMQAPEVTWWKRTYAPRMFAADY